jgi:hypothetical protein
MFALEGSDVSGTAVEESFFLGISGEELHLNQPSFPR